MIEISLHGRGGQGVVAAGELLVRAAVKQGIYAQSIPFFGGERRGAPVRSGVRISDRPIYTHEGIKNADIITVFDTSLLNIINIGILKENGSLLVNAPSVQKIVSNTYYVDATSIAKSLGLVIAGWPLVNTALMGALAKLSGLVNIEDLKAIAKEQFSGERGELNAQAIELGANRVRKVG
ncbi:MAG: 2-oxoacid:acceptor oxidoreductase family protein [Candidatus Micrarchaeales archaeon]